MKKLLILLFSLLISFNSYGLFGLFEKTACVKTDAKFKGGIIYLLNETKPFSGTNLCKYENGQNKTEGKYKKGNQHGKWTSWYENGQIKFVRSYWSDGRISQELRYQDGMDDGWTRYSYYDNGQMKEMNNYKTHNFFKEEGSQQQWYKDGQKKRSINWKDGEADGRFMWWYPGGQLRTVRYWIDGEIQYTKEY